MLMVRTMLSHYCRRSLAATAGAALLLTMSVACTLAQDSTSVEVVDGNLLVGVGLVIGLPGTGDSTVDQKTVETSIVGVLRRAGLEPWRDQLKPGRVAIVMLSAELPAGSGDGAKIDVSVSAIGDARSIAGGTLLVTPLRDAGGIVHATGQGLISMDASSRRAVEGIHAVADLREAEIAGGAVVARQQSRQDDYASLTTATAED